MITSLKWWTVPGTLTNLELPNKPGVTALAKVMSEMLLKDLKLLNRVRHFTLDSTRNQHSKKRLQDHLSVRVSGQLRELKISSETTTLDPQLPLASSRDLRLLNKNLPKALTLHLRPTPSFAKLWRQLLPREELVEFRDFLDRSESLMITTAWLSVTKNSSSAFMTFRLASTIKRPFVSSQSTM